MEIKSVYIKEIKRNFIKDILVIICAILLKIFLIYASLNSYLFIRLTIYMLCTLLIIFEMFIIKSLISFPLKQRVLLLEKGTILEVNVNEIEITDEDIKINDKVVLQYANQSNLHTYLEKTLVASKFELKNDTIDILCQENTDSFVVLNRYKYNNLCEK